MNGFYGRILKVDLTNREFQIETPNEDIYRKYLGVDLLYIECDQEDLYLLKKDFLQLS